MKRWFALGVLIVFSISAYAQEYDAWLGNENERTLFWKILSTQSVESPSGIFGQVFGDVSSATVADASNQIPFDDLEAITASLWYRMAYHNHGTGTAGKLPKWANTSGGLTDSVITESGGKIGIGVSPGVLLDVQQSVAGDSNILKLLNTDTANRMTYLFLGQGLASGRSMAFGFKDNSDGSSGYAFLSIYGGTPGDAIVVKKGGNVGIGTTAPAYKLDVNGTTRSTNLIVTSNVTGTIPSHIAIQTGSDNTFRWQQLGDFVNHLSLSGGIGGGNIGGSGTAGYVAKWIAGATIANSVLYDDSTNVGVGKTPTDGKKLDVAGSIRAQDDLAGSTLSVGAVSKANVSSATVADASNQIPMDTLEYITADLWYRMAYHNHGTGTVGTLAKFTGTSTIGDSIIKESGNSAGVNDVFASANFAVKHTGDAGGLYVYDQSLVETVGAGIYNLAYPVYVAGETTARSYHGIYNNLSPIINGGRSNGSNMMGIASYVMRNATGTAADDNGVLGSLFGMYFQYGHNNTNASAVPTTSNAYGLYFSPFWRTGTITNMYDLYLASPTIGSATTPNYYSIYQQWANSKNYFAGSLGIKTTAPAYVLDVNGEARVSKLHFPDAYGDKLLLKSTLYGINLDVNEFNLFSDRYFTMSSDTNQDAFIFDADTGNLNIKGIYTGNGSGITNVNALTLGGYPHTEFVKRAGDSMYGSLVMGNNYIAFDDNETLDKIRFGSIYKIGLEPYSMTFQSDRDFNFRNNEGFSLFKLDGANNKAIVYSDLDIQSNNVTQANKVHLNSLVFDTARTEATEGALLAALETGEVVLWKPNGQPLAMAVKYGPNDLRWQTLITMANAKNYPKDKYALAIEYGGQVYLAQVHRGY